MLLIIIHGVVDEREMCIRDRIGYGLMWSDRQFDEINNGKRFPAKYDNRHKLNIVANWKINEKLEPVSYTHLDVYKRQINTYLLKLSQNYESFWLFLSIAL